MKFRCALILALAALPPPAEAGEIPASVLGKMKNEWRVRCDVSSRAILEAVAARQAAIVAKVSALAAEKGLRVEMLSPKVGTQFLSYPNVAYKLGVLNSIEFRTDRGDVFTIRTRSRDRKGFFHRAGIYMQFNPVDTGPGQACKIVPVTSYAVREGEDASLPLYQFVDSRTGKVFAASNLGLYQTKRLPSPPARPGKTRRGSTAKPPVDESANRLYGACRNRTLEDEINRRPCYRYASPYFDPNDPNYYLSGYGAQQWRERKR